MLMHSKNNTPKLNTFKLVIAIPWIWHMLTFWQVNSYSYPWQNTACKCVNLRGSQSTINFYFSIRNFPLFLEDWKNLDRLSERLAPFGIIEAQLKAFLTQRSILYSVVMSEGFQEPSMMPTHATVIKETTVRRIVIDLYIFFMHINFIYIYLYI